MTKEQQLAAQKALHARKRETVERVDNSKLDAGSPLHFYCQMCGHESDVRCESDYSPVLRHCTECQKMLNAGWVIDKKMFVDLSHDHARLAEIEDELGSGRGWGAHAFFHHSGGKVPLRQAEHVWNLAQELVQIAKSQRKSDLS